MLKRTFQQGVYKGQSMDAGRVRRRCRITDGLRPGSAFAADGGISSLFAIPAIGFIRAFRQSPGASGNQLSFPGF